MISEMGLEMIVTYIELNHDLSWFHDINSPTHDQSHDVGQLGHDGSRWSTSGLILTVNGLKMAEKLPAALV